MDRNPANLVRAIALSLSFLLLVIFAGCGGVSPSGTIGKGDDLSQVSLSPTSATLAKGTHLQLSATATYSSGRTQDVTSAATWKTSDASVADVTSDGNLSAVSVGTATVSAQYQGLSGTDTVTVGPATLVSIAVTPASSSLPVGESEQLIASGTLTDATTQNLTQSVVWSSLGPTVAGVNSAGLATGKAIGSTSFAATSGNISGAAQVTVTQAVPVALSISPSTIAIVLGGRRQLKAVARYSDGSTQDATASSHWSSSAEDVIQVDDQGLTVAEQVGTATISATASGLEATADATIVPIVLTHYFDLASAQAADLDPSVFVTSPGQITSDLCSMVYILDQNQAMSECCGCRISDSGLLMLSLKDDLTSNPLTGNTPSSGVIKIVSSDLTSNPKCDPSSLTPVGLILAWGTNVQIKDDSTPRFVETGFDRRQFTPTELTGLSNSCAAIQRLGSGHGICSCGTSD